MLMYLKKRNSILSAFFSGFSDGVTYAKVAFELNISLGEFSVILDEYRKQEAPLAAKWING